MYLHEVVVHLLTEGPGLGRETLQNLPYFMYKKT